MPALSTAKENKNAYYCSKVFALLYLFIVYVMHLCVICTYLSAFTNVCVWRPEEDVGCPTLSL